MNLYGERTPFHRYDPMDTLRMRTGYWPTVLDFFIPRWSTLTYIHTYMCTNMCAQDNIKETKERIERIVHFSIENIVNANNRFVFPQ